MRQLTIENTVISDESDCYVIAEIGHNHQGNIEIAKEMFKIAKFCGANAVKLQKRDNRNLFTGQMYNQPYVNRNSYGDTYGSHREALELGFDEYQELQKLAKELDITFFATPFDFQSADFLAKLDMPAYKIASGDLTNTPLLKHIAQLQKPLIISTGGGRMEDVQRAYDTVMPINPRLAILQCTANYPAEYSELNLNVIKTFRDRFRNIVIGYSSHDNGISMALPAYMTGARIIEKHFTLNHTWKGTDNVFSLEPEGLRKLVRDLRRIRAALGDGVKRMQASEKSAITKMGKKLVAKRDLPKGHRVTRDDIAIKSPGDGLPPYELDKLIGQVLAVDLKEDDNLSFECLASFHDFDLDNELGHHLSTPAGLLTGP